MEIGLGQKSYLFDLLKGHNPKSEFMVGDYENGYPLFEKAAEKLTDPIYRKLLALLFNDKVEEAESIMKSL